MATATRRPRARRSGTTSDRNLPVVKALEGEVVDQEPALAIEGRVKDALRQGQSALWRLSEALYEFDEQKGWAALGYDNLSKWLEDPEIDMTRGTYYRLVRTWRTMAVEKGIALDQLESVSMSKAALVADEVAAGDVRPATALKDVATLPASELREKYEKPRRGRPPKASQRRKPEQHSSSTALKAAGELPWDWVEQAVSGRAPLQLREARLREALQALLDWRSEYLA